MVNYKQKTANAAAGAAAGGADDRASMLYGGVTGFNCHAAAAPPLCRHTTTTTALTTNPLTGWELHEPIAEHNNADADLLAAVLRHDKYFTTLLKRCGCLCLCVLGAPAQSRNADDADNDTHDDDDDDDDLMTITVHRCVAEVGLAARRRSKENMCVVFAGGRDAAAKAVTDLREVFPYVFVSCLDGGGDLVGTLCRFFTDANPSGRSVVFDANNNPHHPWHHPRVHLFVMKCDCQLTMLYQRCYACKFVQCIDESDEGHLEFIRFMHKVLMSPRHARAIASYSYPCGSCSTVKRHVKPDETPTTVETLQLRLVMMDARSDNLCNVMAMLVAIGNVVGSSAVALHRASQPFVFFTVRDPSFYQKEFDKVYPGLSSRIRFETMVDVHGAQLTEANFTIDAYNALLTSERFWEEQMARAFSCDGNNLAVAEQCKRMVLMIQDDGVLARPCDVCAEFSQYDFVGAPWLGCADAMEALYGDMGRNVVGNGGFSLRDVDACTRACRCAKDLGCRRLVASNACPLPEDVMFAKVMGLMGSQHFRLPADVRKAATFSVEFGISPEYLPYGVHKVWNYNPRECVARLYERLISLIHL